MDPINKGAIGAMEAANFLKKSNVSQVILSQVCQILFLHFSLKTIILTTYIINIF